MVSASVNNRISPRAWRAPCQHAHCLPNHPSGTGAPSITTLRAARPPSTARATPPVSSSLRSSTTMISSSG